ncbi:uncharacterized protein LOC132315551 [Cornus florida]|uniref:uncharacterized protein LOC132315551 n=1 Tax=Cornus florida TaxID=4283 RepID=UPI00289D4E35|nr:uncharacterized protein LOC132315551 [Cornus florida]XP_059669891.1 uncharacterized protein LOC132315551 [Cornus florida]XP_059669892.1 uncharacterized protein LOC132315551 [Cornus florida]XP_059669893.1 uncharacterized protein LOC132315551 [Cornus florida]XP_059669900.1 uncharacterized protein LOC132315551 [Cornus florida]
MKCPLPSKFRMPTIESFDGTKDPLDHLETFQALMHLHAMPDEIMCRAFPTTLKGSARVWFNKLKPGTIETFEELSKGFVGHFIAGQRHRRPATYLLTVKQQKGESLRDYISRFNTEMLQVEETDDKVALAAFMGGLQTSRFLFSLSEEPPTNMAELLVRAKRHMNAEDAMIARKGKEGEDKKSDKKRPALTIRDEKETKYKKPMVNQNERASRYKNTERYTNYTPLNMPIDQVFLQIQDEPYLKWPPKLKSDPARRPRDKYCRFYKDHGHATEDCFDLKDQIETLVRRGHMRKFIVGNDRTDINSLRAGRDNHPPDQQPIGEIRVIAGGCAGGGESSSARKAYARRMRSSSEVCEVGVQIQHRKMPRLGDPVITFSDEDMKDVQQPHDDPLVVAMMIANYNTRRILVDNGSSADIIFLDAFSKMKIGKEKLRPTRSPLVGFTGDKVYPLGAVILPVTAGTSPKQVTVMVDFLVVDCPSAYNVILGRATLNSMRAITSTYHLLMRFPTEHGVGELRGDQSIARECYVASLKEKRQEEALIVDEVEENEQDRAKPIEDLVEICLNDTDITKKVKIGSLLPSDFTNILIQFLKQNQDVFAWSHEDMPGINPTTIEHRLNTDPTFKPIRQKRRTFAAERNMAILEEVNKLMKADFIQEVHYPDWLANVVLVKKANGKWRLCVDFTDLNKACSKDSFPLPRIDMLVEGTAGHELLSFMDAYSGYNQISMHTPDRDKTSFITDRGLYCYKVMPFGLKNAGATYQRLVNLMFKDQIRRNMEVYVDDMLVKSLKAQDHLVDLQETFQVLRKHQMKLNPSKCAFGVSSGKFLGYMVSRRGIEANPEKVQAILNMQSPASTKELQRLTGRIAALNRLISRATDRCLPFFRVVRKAFSWTPECEQAFIELKEYLTSPPLLSRAMQGEQLYLYLAVSPSAVSSALVREEDGNQKPVYYISRAFRGAEERYPRIEKLAFALVISARKLRPYFQAHTIIVLTDQPLRQVLRKPDTSGRLMKWSVELGEFDIQYKPRTALKAQVLADVIAEFTPEDGPKHAADKQEEAESTWTLYVDGSVNARASGAGLVIISPNGECIKYALRFGFKATNNEAEYEALLAGLRMAKALEVERLVAYTDSQLITGQVQGEYEAKDEKMKTYLHKIEDIKGFLKKFSIHRIPREENAQADALARLATTEEDKAIPVGYLDEPSTVWDWPQKIHQLAYGMEWAEPIIRYIENEELPQDRMEARKIRMRAAKYSLVDGVLYKKGFSLPYLRCVSIDEANYILKDIHEGLCGNHAGGRSLAHKAIR